MALYAVKALRHRGMDSIAMGNDEREEAEREARQWPARIVGGALFLFGLGVVTVRWEPGAALIAAGVAIAALSFLIR